MENLPHHWRQSRNPRPVLMTIYDSILITGGHGMLARALLRSLTARSKSPTLASRAQLDITDEKGVGSLFSNLRPTLLLNCAAYTKVDKAEEEPDRAAAVNGHALANLVAI